MRMKNVCLSGLVTLAALLSACDSTVGLDPTRPTFTKVLVPGVCPLTLTHLAYDCRFFSLTVEVCFRIVGFNESSSSD